MLYKMSHATTILSVSVFNRGTWKNPEVTGHACAVAVCLRRCYVDIASVSRVELYNSLRLSLQTGDLIKLVLTNESVSLLENLINKTILQYTRPHVSHI